MSTGSACAVVGADLRTVLLRERADALTDSVRARRQRSFALVYLLNDLLPPIAWICAASGGGLDRNACRAYREQGRREPDGPLGGDHADRLSEKRHVKTSLEICGVVLRLRRDGAGPGALSSCVLKLLLQPTVESVSAFHAHSSRGTIDIAEILISPSR